jgi:hypothetical protein
VTKEDTPSAGASASSTFSTGRHDPKDKGLFLEDVALQPDLCRYISEAFYEDGSSRTRHDGQIISRALVEARTSPWTVEHEQNSSRHRKKRRSSSRSSRPHRTPRTNQKGRSASSPSRTSSSSQPNNLQVGEIERRFQERFGVRGRVGTVDKFQGQEGAVVL